MIISRTGTYPLDVNVAEILLELDDHEIMGIKQEIWHSILLFQSHNDAYVLVISRCCPDDSVFDYQYARQIDKGCIGELLMDWNPLRRLGKPKAVLDDVKQRFDVLAMQFIHTADDIIGHTMTEHIR